jgi:hypothetical protein
MSFLKIENASREGAKTVTAFAGVSGSGKTYSAILYAYGLAKRRADKVGFLDTENRRGRLYADILPGKAQFLIADMGAPFSPARYAEAIKQFEAAGVEVLVIDSVTHEWEGIGGCDDIANDGVPPGKPGRWNKAKREHKKFMDTMLQSSMHIVVCVRAREKTKIDKDSQGKTIFIPQGIQPVQEKNFMFEMTASLMMDDQGARQDVLKCPAALQPFLGRGTGYIGIQDGESVRAWIDGGTPVNKELERCRAMLANTCEQGMKALEAAWKSLTPQAREALKAELPALKASAAGYDQQREIASRADESEMTEAATAALMRGKTNDQPPTTATTTTDDAPFTD